MNIVLNQPECWYVLVDKNTGEFYAGRGSTTYEVMDAKHWGSLSTARGQKTMYENDYGKGYHLWRGPMYQFEIRRLEIHQYKLLS